MFSLARIRLATTRSSISVPLPEPGAGFAVCAASATVKPAAAATTMTTPQYVLPLIPPLLQVREIALRLARRILDRPLLELHRRDSKHPVGVRLAARHLGGPRGCLLVAQDHEQLPCAVVITSSADTRIS